jgi:N-acetylmuramoyl-L-alanine amidase
VAFKKQIMTKTARIIKYIVVHCTATPPTTTVESIKNYWRKKWKSDVPGYHYIILRDGTVTQLLDESKNSYGVYGHNPVCLNISYIGGIDKAGKPIDNRTPAQKRAMFDLIVRLTEKYKAAEVTGHRDFAGVKKACPCFDVKKWLSEYEPDFLDAA